MDGVSKRDLLLLLADLLVGVEETGGNNRGRMISRFQASVGLQQGEPYCAAGIVFLLDEVDAFGARHNDFNRHVIPRTGWSIGMFHACPQRARLQHPLPGAIMFWEHRDPAGKAAGKGHVGLVESVEPEKNQVTTIEFNTNESGSREGGGVYRKHRNMVRDGDLWVLGWVSPWPGIL